MKRLILLISVLAGTGDFLTGLLLLAVPQIALKLMGVPAVADLVWIQFVGAFVACVGFSYFSGLGAWKKGQFLNPLETVWRLTAIFRLAVGSFVLASIAGGKLDARWASVTAIDYFWALLQLSILAKGGFEDA